MSQHAFEKEQRFEAGAISAGDAESLLGFVRLIVNNNAWKGLKQVMTGFHVMKNEPFLLAVHSIWVWVTEPVSSVI